MIKPCIAAIFALGLAVPAHAQGGGELYRSGIINLRVNDKAQDWRIDYPGPISGVCGLTLQTQSDVRLSVDQLNDLANRLVIKDGFTGEGTEITPSEDQIGANRTWEVLSKNTFVTILHISTKDGRSLKSNVASVVKSPDTLVALVALPCEGSND